MIDPAPIRERFSALVLYLNERERRLLAATEAHAAGYGGIAAVMEATGIAASTIGRGLKELAGDAAVDPGRGRRMGERPLPNRVVGKRRLPARPQREHGVSTAST